MTQIPPPLWKQLLGASAGALVALGLYGVYEGVAPNLEAYLVPKETLFKNTLANRRNVPPQTQARFDRIAKKTQAMVEEFDNQRNLNVLEEGLMQVSAEAIKESEAVSSSPSMEEPSVPLVEPVLPLVATVTESSGQETPVLPQSGVGTAFGILAAFTGGILSLRRRKNGQ